MKNGISILISTLCLCSAYGQTSDVEGATATTQVDSTAIRTDFRDDVIIYYRFDDDNIDSLYLSNEESLEFVDKQLSDTTAFKYLDSLTISAISSPEGPLSYNTNLSKRRAESLQKYLVDKYPHSESKIKLGFSGEEWSRLRDMVVESTKIPNKDEVLAIIDSDDDLDVKESRLKTLANGVSWRFITYNMLRYLRYGAYAIFYYDIAYLQMVQPEPVTEDEPVTEPEPEPEPESEADSTKLVVNVKTNLLYDLALTPNIELEVPIRNRWSINGEFGRGWWLKQHTWCWQLQEYGAEVRYWLGDRSEREQLTGWFVGAFSSAGICDFQFKETRGVQSDFLFAAGLSGGYSKRLKSRLSIEFSAGLGYIVNEYQWYWVEQNTTLIEEGQRMKMKSLLPAKAKVSIGWLIFKKIKVKDDEE